MSRELAAEIGKRFIQRRNVKAVQMDDGKYVPDFKLKAGAEKWGRTYHGTIGFKMPDLVDHLEGTKSYGHYLLDDDSIARVMCFDIDLEKEGNYVKFPTPSTDPWQTMESRELEVVESINPRELWLDRRATDARNWYKYQMRMLAGKVVNQILELGIPGCAAAYSGSKGIHVYGFTGPLHADAVREGALYVMDALKWEPKRGDSFFVDPEFDPVMGYRNLSIEVYPKQGSLENKALGNLLRLPLGKNRKSKDPTFFLDMRAPMTQLLPHKDPLKLLRTGDPFC